MPQGKDVFLAGSLLALCISNACAQESREDSQEKIRQLDRVNVKGEAQPYRDLYVAGAIKTDALSKDIPMSVRVLTSDLLKDAGIKDLTSALDMVSGVTQQSNLGGLWNSYSMRGFTGNPSFGSDYMVNGFNSSRGYNGPRDNFNANTIEVLKGPSSALYGRGEPGGTVNITTKKPLFKPRYEVGLSAGSFDMYRATADLTGPLSETVAYRLNAAYQEANSYRDFVSSDRILVSPSFLWMASEDTVVSYEVEATRYKAFFDRGVVAVDGRLGVVPISRNLAEPSDGLGKVESTGHQLFVQHALNMDWSIQSGLSYRNSHLSGASTEVWNFLNPTTVRRMLRTRDYDGKDLAGRFEVLGTIPAGSVVNNVLFGVDAYRFVETRFSARARSTAMPYTLDIFNPVYGVSQHAPFLDNIDRQETQKSYSVYGQDQIEFGSRWKALIGARRDWYDQFVDDYLQDNEVDQTLSQTTYRAGLVYQPTDKFSFYATASNGFRPNRGIAKEGYSFDPEESVSHEVGVKLDSPSLKYSGTLALYQIVKENVLTPDPEDVSYFITVGEMESKGVELDLAGDITPSLRVSLAYAYTDSVVRKSSPAAAATGLAEGRAFPNVPKHSGNVFALYHGKTASGSWSLGAGYLYTGERLGSVDINDDFTLPSYGLFKLIGSYSPNSRLKFSIEANNLFDKEHYTYSYSNLWVYPGSPRSYTVSMNYLF